jgi:hypothetical protein
MILFQAYSGGPDDGVVAYMEDMSSVQRHHKPPTGAFGGTYLAFLI